MQIKLNRNEFALYAWRGLTNHIMRKKSSPTQFHIKGRVFPTLSQQVGQLHSVLEH